MLEDWPKVYDRIKEVPRLDEHEKILFARSMAATPEERWAMNLIKNEKNWLPNMDLNHDKQIQRLLCYRYTIRQWHGPTT